MAEPEKQEIEPNESEQTKQTETLPLEVKQSDQSEKPETKKSESASKKKSKLWLIIGGIVGALFVIFIILAILGWSSSDSVFKDMNSKMLKTKSALITVTYKGTMAEAGQIDMTSNIYIDMSSQQTLKSKGDFSVNLVANSIPMTIKADFVAIGDSKYIKFKEFTSSDSSIAATFSQIEAKLKDQWIKSRSSDSYSTFINTPLETVLTVLPTPYAFLTDSQSDNVVKIMHDKSTYTIEESSKVELGSEDAFKYVLTYNKDKYNEFSKIITSYVSYFKNSSGDGNDIKSYSVWINSSTKRIAKIEFVGSSKEGNIEGKMQFSNYDQNFNITKPEDYSIESELIQ